MPSLSADGYATGDYTKRLALTTTLSHDPSRNRAWMIVIFVLTILSEKCIVLSMNPLRAQIASCSTTAIIIT